MPLVDPEHPFFARRWVRWFWTLAPIGMAVLEFLSGSVAWGTLFLAAGVYLGWVLLIRS